MEQVNGLYVSEAIDTLRKGCEHFQTAARTNHSPAAAKMDATGSEKLRDWLEQQSHWQQADAVQQGDQPPTDPDAWELEELGEGLRLYGVREEQRRVIDGRAALLIQRLTKRLVEGRWQTVYEVEQIRPL